MPPPLQIILKSGKDEAVRRFHPWVFSGAIKKMVGAAYDGAHAEVFSNQMEYLGGGLFQDATISVRLLSFAPERPASFDQGFWNERLARAYNLRSQLGLTGNPDTNVYRLVHGEGDHIPGLIIDHYDGHLVIQIHATGLYSYLPEITHAIKEVYGHQLKSIYDKSQTTLPEEFHRKNKSGGDLFGTSGVIEIMENNKQCLVDIPGGQKTGFFIDQRENRKLLGQYCKEKTVLNTYCYTGGFSVYALAAGAAEVYSVDSSASAMELTERNVHLNFGQDNRHRAIVDDAMQMIRQSKTLFDVIVLDPPAFAKHVHVKHNAVQGYKRLNLAAIEKVKSPGILFTFSCSQVVDMNLFRSTVMSAAILAKRKARILHQLTQPPDHPVNMFHPEGQYLKGLVVHID